jgi:3-deoxy-D-manno-octulosonate 8-phosphate phosphatase (KDO 8-P phosphatase)
LSAVSQEALDRARGVRLMVFDVDGVLTDGTLLYGPAGEELKAFSAHDGHGLKMLAASGVACAVLSGRRSAAVATRAAELGIETVLQGIEDKLAAFQSMVRQQGFTLEKAGYMGDELVDLPVLTRCGFACAPREAPEAVRQRVHYVAAAAAGRGAAREVCELVMRAQRTFDPALGKYLA